MKAPLPPVPQMHNAPAGARPWWEEPAWSHLCTTLFVLVLGIVTMFWGEKMQANQGFGWDGIIYAGMVRRLPEMIPAGELTSYYAQRILPSSLVRGLLVAAGASFTPENIVRGFEVLNLAMLLVSCWLWKRIADEVTLGAAARWLGLAALFINFFASKQAFFNPVFTDVTAYTVSLAMLLCYLRGWRIALLCLALVGAFAWPTIAPTGAILLAFPRSYQANPEGVGGPTRKTPWVRIYVAFAITCLLLFLLLHLRLDLADAMCRGAFQVAISPMSPKQQAIASTLRFFDADDPCRFVRQVLTAAPSLAGMGVLLHALWRRTGGMATLRQVPRRLRSGDLLLAAIALVLPALVVRTISNAALPPPSSVTGLLILFLLPDEGKFYLPVVTLTALWGPTVLLLLLGWHRICARAGQLGLGFAGVIAATLPFTLAYEPRFLTSAWPFLVLCWLLTLERGTLHRHLLVPYVLLTLLFAQFWLQINIAPWNETMAFKDFPMQMWYMHYGPFMGWPAYVAQASVVAVGAMWFWVAGRRTRS